MINQLLKILTCYLFCVATPFYLFIVQYILICTIILALTYVQVPTWNPFIHYHLLLLILKILYNVGTYLHITLPQLVRLYLDIWEINKLTTLMIVYICVCMVMLCYVMLSHIHILLHYVIICAYHTSILREIHTHTCNSYPSLDCLLKYNINYALCR